MGVSSAGWILLGEPAEYILTVSTLTSQGIERRPPPQGLNRSPWCPRRYCPRRYCPRRYCPRRCCPRRCCPNSSDPTRCCPRRCSSNSHHPRHSCPRREPPS